MRSIVVMVKKASEELSRLPISRASRDQASSRVDTRIFSRVSTKSSQDSVNECGLLRLNTWQLSVFLPSMWLLESSGSALQGKKHICGTTLDETYLSPIA
jgi:hypothetical protein